MLLHVFFIIPFSVNCGNQEKAAHIITLEDPIESIGDYAFRGCVSLQEIRFSEELTTIGEYAFQNCTSLTEINLGSVGYVYNGAFSGCTALKTAVVPEIPSFIFSGCTSLTDVTVVFGDYSDARFAAFSGSS